MGKIFINQPFKVELSYDELPAAAESQQIGYKKPSGEIGFFDASIDLVNKFVYYWSAIGETLGSEGEWSFWSVIIDANGQRYSGEPITQMIYPEGQ